MNLGIFQSRSISVSEAVNRLEIVQPMSPFSVLYFIGIFDTKKERQTQVTMKKWRFIDGCI